MKRLTVLAALLVLSLAPALQAQGRGYPSQDRYRYPNSGQGNRVAALARELEDTATYIHREFERNNRRPNRAEARVAADLHELNAQAARLQRQIEGRGYRDGYDSRNDDRYRQDGQYRGGRNRDDSFAQLEEAFFSLSDSLRYIQPRPYVDRGMDQIYSLMNELGRYYGRSGYGKGYQGRDRYGRDRYDGSRDRYDGHDYRPPQH